MEIIEYPIQMWITFSLIVAGIISYTIHKIPMEITSLGIITALLSLFHFMPLTSTSGTLLIDAKNLLAGFADPALITILSLLVIGRGLVETGALDTPVKILIRIGKNHPAAILTFSLAIAMVISAFLNDTPVVVIFIPIMISLAEKLGRHPSLYLMPLSYAAILGGMTTLIGSSTNLLVAGTYKTISGVSLGFFDFVIPGIVLASIGFIYVFFIGPKILPKNQNRDSQNIKITGKQFIIQLDLSPDNKLIGEKTIAGMFPSLNGMTVQFIRRGHEDFHPPFDDLTLRSGDCLVIATTRDSLVQNIANNNNLTADLNISFKGTTTNLPYSGSRQKLVEVLVSPVSRLNGRTMAQAGFLLDDGSAIIGVQRHNRMVRCSIKNIRLETGDKLLVLGTKSQIKSLRMNKDVMLMEWSVTDIPVRAATWKALTIFASFIVMASSGIVPTAIAATLCALAMIICRCLSVRQAANAIDRKIYMLIGAALAMATSLQLTGGASYLAMNMIDALQGASTPIILSAFFLLISVLTNILSNNATAVLFTPIAINVATEINADPFIFVTTVIFAANCSFATPMGYQTNLLVLASGNYRFSDFMKLGIPLIFILWVSYSFFAPYYYRL